MKSVYIFCALVALTACQPKPERYRITVLERGGIVMKLDTETGQSWQYERGIWKSIPTAP